MPRALATGPSSGVCLRFVGRKSPTKTLAGLLVDDQLFHETLCNSASPVNPVPSEPLSSGTHPHAHPIGTRDSSEITVLS